MRALLFILMISLGAQAELVMLDDDDLGNAVAQSGISIEVVMQDEANIYYLDTDASAQDGGAILLEGVQLVAADSDGLPDTSRIVSVVNRFDVTEDGLTLQSIFPDRDAAACGAGNDSACGSLIKVDAVKLVSTVTTPGGSESFSNVLSNASSANSLGSLSISGISGSAVVTVRSQ